MPTHLGVVGIKEASCKSFNESMMRMKSFKVSQSCSGWRTVIFSLKAVRHRANVYWNGNMDAASPGECLSKSKARSPCRSFLRFTNIYQIVITDFKTAFLPRAWHKGPIKPDKNTKHVSASPMSHPWKSGCYFVYRCFVIRRSLLTNCIAKYACLHWKKVTPRELFLEFFYYSSRNN